MQLRIVRVATGAILLAIVAATLCPIGDRPTVSSDPQLERFGAFLMLGFSSALAFPRQRALVALGTVACALGLEALQHLAPGRHGELGDALMKALGGILGVLAVDVAQRAKTEP